MVIDTVIILITSYYFMCEDCLCKMFDNIFLKDNQDSREEDSVLFNANIPILKII